MPNEPVIRLPRLTRAEYLELREFLGTTQVEREEEPVEEGELGELALATAVIVATIPAVKALVAYLAFRHRGKSFEQVIELETPEGARFKKTIRWRDTSSEPVDVALAKELASTVGVDVGSVLRET
jgi:hypothetical protein